MELKGGKLWHALVRNELSNMQRIIILFFLIPTPLVFVLGQQIKASSVAPTASEYPLNAPPHAFLGGTDNRKRADSGVYCAFCKADLPDYSMVMKGKYKERKEHIWGNMTTEAEILYFFKSSTDSILTVLCRELRGDVMVVSGGMIGDRARASGGR